MRIKLTSNYREVSQYLLPYLRWLPKMMLEATVSQYYFQISSVVVTKLDSIWKKQKFGILSESCDIRIRIWVRHRHNTRLVRKCCWCRNILSTSTFITAVFFLIEKIINLVIFKGNQYFFYFIDNKIYCSSGAWEFFHGQALQQCYCNYIIS